MTQPLQPTATASAPLVHSSGQAASDESSLPSGALQEVRTFVTSVGTDAARSVGGSGPTVSSCECGFRDPFWGEGWTLAEVRTPQRQGSTLVTRLRLEAPDGGSASLVAVITQAGTGWSLDSLHRAGQFDPPSTQETSPQAQRLEHGVALVSTAAATTEAEAIAQVRMWAARTDQNVSVDPDPVAGAIVAEGSVLLPPSFDGDAELRSSAADCPECRWRLRIACSTQDVLCGGAFIGCPAGATRWLVELLRAPATDYVVVGTICRFPSDDLLAPGALGERVAERFVELLPRSAPTFQPRSGGLVNLPTVFAAGEPAAIGPVAARVVGYSVQISATASWQWDFGDGRTLVTALPGGAYPNTSVTHTYQRPGSRTVTLVSRWTGEFTVGGEGPYPVPGGAIELVSQIELPVREAGARLVAP